MTNKSEFGDAPLKVEGGAYYPFPPKPGTVAWVRMVLETAQRQGTEKDEPEGTRYIHLSATLADLMIKSLEEEQ